MDYNYKIINMCESKLYPDRPEYLNSFSALYMCYISLSYLFKKSKDRISHSITILYWCVFMNGIGSFLYHWHGWYIFKLLDEFTMILPVWIGISKILYNLNYSVYYTGIFTIFNISILILDVFIWFQDYFALMFAIELITIIPLYYKALEYKSDKLSIGLRGITICCGSGLLWVIIEANCNKYLIFGHSIWHIGMSTGLCYIIEYFKNLENGATLLPHQANIHND